MKVFLASVADSEKLQDKDKIKYVLESFYTIKKWQLPYIQNVWEDFLLDSGAFTFINSKPDVTIKDINTYVRKYIDFINKYDIQKFFEMDIDPIVGIEKVEQFRDLIEKETGKKSIPVWHKSRGKQYFLDLVKTYDYVSIGGLVTREIKQKEHIYLDWFIKTAHENGCKIHGLGYTNIEGVKKHNFDSVDSTSWKSGRRFGQVYNFESNTLKMYKFKRKRLKDTGKADEQNLKAWIEFQNYMDSYSSF